MTRSPHEPRPVKLGRYRYSKLRWRILVRAFDSAGSMVLPLWRRIFPLRSSGTPTRILIVQLDHLGDAVLTSPLVSRLKAEYPEASIDVLASPSNSEVFEAIPGLDHVRVAERTWFERRPGRRGLLRAVWSLGMSLRGAGYDLGFDVRGDILSVTVLALGGIPRRVGWAMGGGAFMLTDVARWVPGRHEVRSRLALLEPLGLDPEPNLSDRVQVRVADEDRIVVAGMLAEAWPRRTPKRHGVVTRVGWRRVSERSRLDRTTFRHEMVLGDEADWLHAGRFGPTPPLLAVHIGAGTAAKRWPLDHWMSLVTRFLHDGWRVIVVGGPEDPSTIGALPRHDRLRDWTGRLSITQATALLERADLFIGADSGPAHLAATAGTLSVILFSGTNQPRQWRPWSSHALILRHRVACRPCHQKVCPLADHPCMSAIDPDRVYRAARRWWSRVNRAESPHSPL